MNFIIIIVIVIVDVVVVFQLLCDFCYVFFYLFITRRHN